MFDIFGGSGYSGPYDTPGGGGGTTTTSGGGGGGGSPYPAPFYQPRMAFNYGTGYRGSLPDSPGLGSLPGMSQNLRMQILPRYLQTRFLLPLMPQYPPPPLSHPIYQEASMRALRQTRRTQEAL